MISSLRWKIVWLQKLQKKRPRIVHLGEAQSYVGENKRLIVNK